MADSAPAVLILDDDEQIAAIIGELAARVGFRADMIGDPSRFRSYLQQAEPALVVLDLQMPGFDGVEALRIMAEIQCRSRVLLVTGMDLRTIGTTEEYARRRGLNLVGSLQKPFAPPELLEHLRRVWNLNAPLQVVDLERAIHENELLLYYQPIVRRFADHRWDVCSVEALLRWNHPERGLLNPDAFIGMGEDGGLARPMTDFVLRRGVEQLRAWRSQNFGIGLRVNVPAQLIADLDFPDRLQSLLLEHDIDPAMLTLEITETAMLDRQENTMDILSRLRIKEINLAIDDFGIGYSSLTQLFRMPFNEMKIDRSLVQKIPEHREARIMVEALVDLAHKLNLTTCAEGVEHPEALEFLYRVGCDEAQGYLISRPVAAQHVGAVLSRWPRGVQDVLQAVSY
jgi:EAL domain-containing protein (putative c-di-GMP-specific phosphodiesterase class I)